MNNHEHTLIGPYILDAVNDEERQLMDTHLEVCQECAHEVAELRETAVRLSDTTITPPPERLRSEVLAAVRRTRQEPPPRGTTPTEGEVSPPRRLKPWHRRLVAAAVAVLLAFASGAVTYIYMQQRLDEQRAETDSINQVLTADDADVATKDTADGGRVTVIASRDHDSAVVVAAGLEQVTTQRAYQLWLVNDAGQESAGVMPAGDDSATMLVSGIGDADLIGVTNEPAGGSASPTLPMVADVPLTSE